MTSLLTAIKSAKKEKNAPLFACVLGAQGGGKSGTLGTFGLPTLIIRTPLENHGTQNAINVAGKLFDKEIQIDEFEIPSTLSGDKQFEALISLLDELIKTDNPYKVVCLDSITDVQLNVIRKADSWMALCSPGGKYSKFNEGSSDIHFFNILLMKLKELSDKKNVHVVVTVAAQLQTLSDDGTEVIARPSLLGTQVAGFINRCCGTVLFVNKINEDGESSHKFLFNTKLRKDSKDLNGRITKTENFNSRIQGILSNDLPESCEASFAKILSKMKG
jgi:hypothetical protein